MKVRRMTYNTVNFKERKDQQKSYKTENLNQNKTNPTKLGVDLTYSSRQAAEPGN